MTSQLEVNINNNISIAELAAQQDAGFSVMRSAHIGNVAPYNMVLAREGFDMLLVDQTVTGVDKTYHPELLLQGGTEQAVAKTGILVCRSAVDVPQLGFEQAHSLDELHIAGLQAAIPGANAFTNTEYLRKRESLVGDITRIAARTMPEIFTRISSPEGEVVKAGEGQDFADIALQRGVIALQDDPRSNTAEVLVPLQVDIVANFIIEALESEKAEQYHLSGPDMALYMRAKNPTAQSVAALYEAVASSPGFAGVLPRKLQVQLVDATPASLATTVNRATHLQSLLGAVDELEQAQMVASQRKRDFYTTGAGKTATRAEKAVFDSEVREALARAGGVVVAAAAQNQELFLTPKTKDFVSQYDVLAEGGLFVPEQTREMSLSELARLKKTITKLTQKGEPS